MDMEFNKVLVDTACNKLVNYSVEDANKLIRQQFAETLGIAEDERNAATIRRAIRKNHADFYTLIEVAVEEIMTTGWGDNPFFRKMVEERNLNRGDRNVFIVPDDSILTVSKVAGDHHDLNRQKLGMGHTYSADISTYAIKVYDEFVRFQTGQIDWVRLIEKIYEAADNKVNAVLYDSFMGLKTAVNPDLKVSGSVNVEKVLETVEKVQSYTGKEVMLVGSRAALSKLSNLTQTVWSEDMKNERNTMGYIGRFEGVETMVIPQVIQKKNGKSQPLYDANTILVLPKTDSKPIKLVWEGDSIFTESTSAGVRLDDTVEAEYQWKMGVTTIVGSDLGMISFV